MKRVVATLLFVSMVGVVCADQSIKFFSCGLLNERWENFKHIQKETGNALVAGLAGEYNGYIQGWADRDVLRSLINFPKIASPRQNQYIVGKYLEDHPEQWHMHAAECVYFAFIEAYGHKE